MTDMIEDFKDLIEDVIYLYEIGMKDLPNMNASADSLLKVYRSAVKMSYNKAVRLKEKWDENLDECKRLNQEMKNE